jgi:hypothetical protein
VKRPSISFLPIWTDSSRRPPEPWQVNNSLYSLSLYINIIRQPCSTSTSAHHCLLQSCLMDRQTRSFSPPPRMPSPQLLPTPLPSPPLHHQQSRTRLSALSQSKPPSPLFRPAATSSSPVVTQRKLHAPRALPHPPLDINLWLDGDDFGTRRERSVSPPTRYPTPPAGSSYDHKRRPAPIATMHPRSRSRPRSPPPSPDRPGTPPPVPPIPTQFLGASPEKPHLTPRSSNHLTPVSRIPNLPPPQSHSPFLRKSRSSNAMTCIRLLTLQDD